MQTRKMEESEMYFALNKATDFSNSLGIHIWIIRVWQGHYVPIQYKDWGERKKKKGKKNISVTFCILTSVLSVGQPGVQYLPSCVSNYLLRNWLKKVISQDETSQSKWHALSSQLHWIQFWFHKTGSWSTMYIFMQVFKKFITVCLAITTLFTL